MKYSRVVYVPTGQRTCEACATPNYAPCELYEYVDDEGAKIVVCYGCCMFCTPEQSIVDFRQRHRHVQ